MHKCACKLIVIQNNKKKNGGQTLTHATLRMSNETTVPESKMDSSILLDLLREFLLNVIASSFVPETSFSSTFWYCWTEKGFLTASRTPDPEKGCSSTTSCESTTGSEENKTVLSGHNYYDVFLTACNHTSTLYILRPWLHETGTNSDRYDSDRRD